MSTDLHTLSGAYALDALSPEEARAFDRHLEECEACREEVHELRAAAAQLGESEATAPPAWLRARVLAAADQMPQMPPKVVPLEVARRRRSMRLVAAAAVVALTVGGGAVAWQAQRDDHQSTVASPVAQVLRSSDAHTKTVRTQHGTLVVATSRRLGRMAVETQGLQPLGDKRVYQLWAVHDGQMTSAAVIKSLRSGAAMAMPGAGTTVAITVEPSGGSKRPTSKPFVLVDPRAV